MNEDTLRGIGGERRERRSIQEDGRAIRADNPIALAHVEIDVRVIVGRRSTDACELPRTDLYLADAQIVFELRVAGSLHGVLSGRLLFLTQRCRLSNRRSEGSYHIDGEKGAEALYDAIDLFFATTESPPSDRRPTQSPSLPGSSSVNYFQPHDPID